ncbi:O-methyltransferase [Streptomyces sp. SID3343]|uniref:O-methyltransferase n=1 Tax=Streptomyces sp. SID3343 TaxID=2690260 RepID=UPI00137106BE|nr:O-methyltransferase [Streptomyces sp. SID3343]MYW00024.1 methyltransferase [Streptomyces sp. SID3343]
MSQQQQWTAMDRYFTDLLGTDDKVLEAARRDSDASGLPPIAVAPNQGRLLQLLAQVRGARRILEIGTLGGYSTIHLARALPADGRLVTLEYAPRHAEVARANIARAGFADRVEVRVGAALDTLPVLAAEGGDPYDMIFVDADKDNYPHYLEWSLRLARIGTLIILDNVVLGGEVLDPAAGPRAQGIRSTMEMLAREPRVSATALQTVGDKGWDGFALALVIG